MAGGIIARMSLRERLATTDSRRRYVRTLFATIADRYDLITVLLSCGRDRAWKRRLTAMASLTPARRVLDLATGTGDLAYMLHDRGALVVGLDVTPRMIDLAMLKRSEPLGPRFVVADMMALPFADGSFEMATTGYGLRNVPDLEEALGEIERVLQPRGRLLSLDFNRPASACIRTLYLAYLSVVGSALGWLLHRDPDTYRYIPESIRRYPGADGVALLMRKHGFSPVNVHPVLFGLLTIHDAMKDNPVRRGEAGGRWRQEVFPPDDISKARGAASHPWYLFRSH
jgi:demethylmenaquinone methyltransferase/2-methoxy-6-polyprenyl-1,4-benzoquinol methylase